MRTRVVWFIIGAGALYLYMHMGSIPALGGGKTTKTGG